VITQRRQTYASHVEFDSFTVSMCLFRSKKILKGSLQPKLKGASVWPFNARSILPTGWICHIWSLYQYCKEKNRSMSTAVISRAIFTCPGRFLGLTQLLAVTNVTSFIKKDDSLPDLVSPSRAWSSKTVFLSFYRAMRAVVAVMQCPSVRPSVRLSRSWMTSKRINISSKFLHHRVATPFQIFHTKGGADIPTGTPLTGASNARGYDKMTTFSQISRCISEKVIVR